MTNETYETVEEIANIFIPGSKPFYGGMFTPISSGIPLEIFRIFGSADHAIVDDLVTWAPLYLSADAIKYLFSSETGPRILLTICSVAGILLGCSLFMMVYLFEGNHTVENLKKLMNELHDAEPSRFPNIIINYLKFTIKLTPILHGLGSATPVCYALRQIISNPDLKLPLAIGLAVLVFIGTAKGTQLSEAREALKGLEERRRPAIATLVSDEYTTLEDDGDSRSNTTDSGRCSSSSDSGRSPKPENSSPAGNSPV